MDRRARFNARKNGDIAPIEARRTLGCWGTASFFFSAEFVEAIFSLSLSLRFYVSKLVGFLVGRMSKGYLNLNLSIY